MKVLIVENKPEAPWIKKEQNCLIFTENLQNFEDPDLLSEPTGTMESVDGKPSFREL